MKSFMLLFLFCHVNPDLIVTDHVDIVEVNHHYDEIGNLNLDQLVYYRIVDNEWQVVDWRLIQRGRELPDPEVAQKWQNEFAIKHNLHNLPNKEQVLPRYTPEFVGCSMIPVKQGDKYVATFYDKNDGVTRRIIADIMFETWTQVDPEYENRKILRREDRRELTKPQKVSKILHGQ